MVCVSTPQNKWSQTKEATPQVQVTFMKWICRTSIFTQGLVSGLILNIKRHPFIHFQVLLIPIWSHMGVGAYTGILGWRQDAGWPGQVSSPSQERTKTNKHTHWHWNLRDDLESINLRSMFLDSTQENTQTPSRKNPTWTWTRVVSL